MRPRAGQAQAIQGADGLSKRSRYP